MAMGDLAIGEKIKNVQHVTLLIKRRKQIGPALYNVVGRKVGGVNDYKYLKHF